jgi:drug/metabolite transporter (DMT)-like permease
MGEIASLLTSICWVLSALFFTEGGKRVGSMVVNRVRMVFGLVLLALVNWLLFGELIPLNAEPERWLWLGLSGLFGLALGDIFLFQSFLWIGPRRAMLIIAGVPVLNTLLAWLFFSEVLTIYAYVGIAVTVAGIFLVLSEKEDENDILAKDRKNFSKGLVFCLLGALGQSAGMLLARHGVGGDFPALTGTLIRAVVATLVFWLLALMTGKVKKTVAAVKDDRRALLWIALGSLAGPFLGIWLSLTGLKFTDVGIASTLQALAPVIMLPVAHYLYKERITGRAVLGTLLSLSGVAVLFLLA